MLFWEITLLFLEVPFQIKYTQHEFMKVGTRLTSSSN